MNAALIIAGIPFFDAPSEIEGAPYWVDLWTDINGYKIGLQVKPSSYRSASMSIYAGMTRASQERGHKRFMEDFGGRVFIVVPKNGELSANEVEQILAEKEYLQSLPPKKE